MEQLHNFAANNTMLLNGIILLIAYIFIVWEKISKVTVALLGAGASLLLSVFITHGTNVTLGEYYYWRCGKF